MLIFESEKVRKGESIKYIFIHSWVSFCLLIMILILSVLYGFSNFVFPLVFSLFFLTLILFAIISKKSRIVDQLAFNDEKKALVLTYTYLFKIFTIEAKYSELTYKFIKKPNSRFYNPMTLEIHINGRYLAEIRYNDTFGWSNNSINLVIDKLKSI